MQRFSGRQEAKAVQPMTEAEVRLRSKARQGIEQINKKIAFLNRQFVSCETLEDVKTVKARCLVIVRIQQVLENYPIDRGDSYYPRVHRNVDEIVAQFRTKLDQACWKLTSKLNALYHFVGKNTTSSQAELKLAIRAISAVLTELKHVDPEAFLQPV